MLWVAGARLVQFFLGSADLGHRVYFADYFFEPYRMAAGDLVYEPVGRPV